MMVHDRIRLIGWGIFLMKGHTLIWEDGHPAYIQHGHPKQGKTHPAAESVYSTGEPCFFCHVHGWNMMYIDEIFPEAGFHWPEGYINGRDSDVGESHMET